MTGSSDAPDEPLGRCPLFGRCGGCSVLDLSEAAYVAAKTARLRDAFAARGLSPPVATLRRSPLPSRRRATFTAVREGRTTRVGYAAARSHTIIDVPECPALAPPLAAALPAIRALAEAAAAPAGTARLTATLCANGIDVAITRPASPRVARAKRGRPPPPPPLVADDPAILRVTVDGDIAFARETPVVTFDGVAVPLPPGAFLQATLEGEAALTALVVEATAGAARVADLFAGLGTFAVPLTRDAAVTAVDMEGPALDALAAAIARTSGRRPLAVLRRNLFGDPLSPAELAPFDAVVFDPPRAGAEAVARNLAASRVPTVVAVSCDPVTLARDAAILAESYEITQATPVDQFVGTLHLEAVTTFRRRP